MPNDTHTPWCISTKLQSHAYIAELDGTPIAFMASPKPYDETRREGESWIDMMQRTESDRLAHGNERDAQRELIVRTVNAHADLVAALENAERALNWIAASGWKPHGTALDNSALAYDCHCTAATELPAIRAALAKAKGAS